MPAASPPEKTAFKNWVNESVYRQLAAGLSELSPGFDHSRFLDLTLDGLDRRELMDRLRQAARAFAATLPGDYPAQLDVLLQLAPRLGRNFASLCFPDFVAREGLAPIHFKRSLDALKFFTPFGSAEFAVRPFIERDLPRTLAVMETWSRDPDEHVRRLASEGSRPRLPWGLRLADLVRDPAPVAPILEQLKADPSLYVRKSVANHLNDITKDHPAWVIDRVSTWDRTHAHTAWIIRHALRTLVKAGHPPALSLLGAGAAPLLDTAHFDLSPRRIKLGDTITLTAHLASKSTRKQRLVIDYVIHYARAGARTSEKVFKWKTIELAPHATASLTKRQLIRDFTTRRHHPGRHRVELQINGRRLAETGFTLQIT